MQHQSCTVSTPCPFNTIFRLSFASTTSPFDLSLLLDFCSAFLYVVSSARPTSDSSFVRPNLALIAALPAKTSENSIAVARLGLASTPVCTRNP